MSDGGDIHSTAADERRHDMSVYARFFLTITCGIVCALGCSTVRVNQPFEENVQLPELAQLDGVWVGYDQVIQVFTTDNAVSQVALVQWDGERFCLREGEIELHVEGLRKFVCLRQKGKAAQVDGWIFAEYAFASENQLVIWPPNATAFVKRINDGRLSGRIDESRVASHVLVTSPPERIVDLLNEKTDDALFLYEEPLVLTRITGREGMERYKQ